MTDRRELFGRAAYRVIARTGLRSLTHRAVDEAAGLPAGSVNYYAPTRSKLHQLALRVAYDDSQRVATRTFAPLIADTESMADQVVDCTVDYVRTMTTDSREVTIARMALLLESQSDADLRAVVTERRVEFVARAEKMTHAARGSRPHRDMELIIALLDGLIQQQTVLTTEPFTDDMLRNAVARAYGFRAD